MDTWADVNIPALNDRLAVEAKALFFIPKALERCNQAGLTTASLSAYSSSHPDPLGYRRAGRSAISKVLKLQPVAYASAISFLAVANEALKSRNVEALTRSDIIACVFRLKDPLEVMKALEVSPLQIVAATGLSESLVNAALSRYRLQYRDAASIWEFARDRKAHRSLFSTETTDGVIGIINDNPADFIKTDARMPIAIRTTADDEFVYNWSNLNAAPRIGHPWAIEG